MTVRHDNIGHIAGKCSYRNGHGVSMGYQSADAADRRAAQPAPEGRRYEVRDNNPNPDKATALEVWCLPAFCLPSEQS